MEIMRIDPKSDCPALAANDIQPEGHVSSDHSNNYIGADDGNSRDDKTCPSELAEL
jgi:hypothetical protein